MASGIYGLRLLAQPRLQRLALALVVALVLVVRLAQFVGWLNGAFWGYDFSAYWQAAANLLHGASPYAPAQLGGSYPAQAQYLYLYPPPVAAAVAPLAAAFADYRLGSWAWNGLGLVLLVTSVLAVARTERLTDRFALLRRHPGWWLLAAALAFPPVVAELVLGNVHLEILGLLSLAWLGLRRGTTTGDLVGGAAIGAAALIKLFPGLLVVWLLLSGRYRAATAAALSFGVLTVVTLPLTGLQPWLDYPTVLANLGPPVYTADTLAPIVWLAPYVGFGIARVVVTGLGLALVALLGWRAGRSRAGDSTGLAAGFGAAVATSVLVAPAVYQHYLALFVLPLLLGLAGRVRLRWLVLSYFLMWGGEQAALGDLDWVVNKGLPTLGALILLAALVAAALGARWALRPETPDGSDPDAQGTTRRWTTFAA